MLVLSASPKPLNICLFFIRAFPRPSNAPNLTFNKNGYLSFLAALDKSSIELTGMNFGWGV